MKLLVFTDLDATLLDEETYSWSAAAEALTSLKERDAAIILVSSKTFAEMTPLHKELGLEHPFVVENGGGIALKAESALVSILLETARTGDPEQRGSLVLFPLAARYDELRAGLEKISANIGVRLVGFGSMSHSEVASRTGLSLKEAARARQRDFDEPFVLPDAEAETEERLVRAAAESGLAVVKGGRFWHLIGHRGKGEAVSILLAAYRALYGNTVSVGLGDSPNDYPFLELVDIPVIVSPPDGISSLPPLLAAALRTALPGPRGWNQAIRTILADLGLA